MSLKRNFTSRRAGFTLIELLVAVGFMLVLASLAVAIVAQSMEQDRVRQGADQMQGWLTMARQYALRNKVPTGIRLSTTDPDTGQTTPFVKSALFIEQPDPFAPGGSVNVWPDPNNLPAALGSSGLPVISTSVIGGGKKSKGNKKSGANNQPTLATGAVMVWTTGADLTGGQTSGLQPGLVAFVDWNQIPPYMPPYTVNIVQPVAQLWPVQLLDWVEVGIANNATAQLYQVQAIYATNTLHPVLYCTSCSPANAVGVQSGTTTTTGQWRIVRQMRPKTGEQILLFPKNSIIDTRTLTWYPQPNGVTTVPDIVFEPSGTVRAFVGSNAQQPIYLWFVDASKDLPPDTQPANNPPYYTNKSYIGKQFVVSVTPQNGFIAVHPVDILSTGINGAGMYDNPYSMSQASDENVFSGL